MIGRQFAWRSLAVGAIGALTVAAGGIGIATAANGGSLLLGHHNDATTTTTLQDRHGTPLSLLGKKSKPPLKVNSRKLVKRLNADEVDGSSAVSLMSNDIQFSLPPTPATGNAVFALPAVPKGVYEASFDIMAFTSAAGITINCHFQRSSDHTFAILSYGGSFDDFTTVMGSGVLDMRTKPVDQFRCFTATGTFTLNTGLALNNVVINLIKINGFSRSSTLNQALTLGRATP
jgi:hypothetical protein